MPEFTFKHARWMAIVIIFSYTSNVIILRLSEKYFSHKKLVPLNFHVRDHFKDSLFWFLLTITLRIIFPLFTFDANVSTKINGVLGFALIYFTTWLLTKALSLLKIIIYYRFSIHNPNNLKQRKIRTQVQFIEKFILIFIYLIAGASVLMRFDGVRELGGSLIASAGLAGITLGFAAQRSLANLFAGFQIAFTQPIRIDDVVIVEGEWGRIEEITLTYVVIRIWDKRTLIVPITFFLEKPFQNWTRASADLIGTVFLYLDYSIPINDLRAEFVNFLTQCPLWDQMIQTVQITNSTEKTIEVRFLMSARNASEAFDLRCLVREHMIHYIQRKFPHSLPKSRLNSTDLHGFSTLDVI
jgi:small-conductance mechanosensitive channel